MVRTLTESTVRFDGFLVDASGVATLIQETTTKNIRNSSLPSQGGSDRFRADWGAANDDRALFVAVREALGDAAGSALDKMEEEIVTYAAKGITELKRLRHIISIVTKPSGFVLMCR